MFNHCPLWGEGGRVRRLPGNDPVWNRPGTGPAVTNGEPLKQRILFSFEFCSIDLHINLRILAMAPRGE